MPLHTLKEGAVGRISAINNHTDVFLAYLQKRGLYIGAKIKIMEYIALDGSLDISIDDYPPRNISQTIGQDIMVVC